MADIFVGYASGDVERVRPLVRLMSDQGWSVWWDHKIPIGKTFDLVIEGELARAGCVVVVWSKASVHSEWVKNEAAEGKRRSILVPAIIDEVTIPFEFRRVETAKLHDWDFQSTSHPELIEFFNAIGETIQQPWSLDGRVMGPGHTQGRGGAEEPQVPPATSSPDAPPPLPESDGQSERQLRARKLLAHWFARSRIPDVVFQQARQLVYRATASGEDQRRMRLLDLCGQEDGALFTRAWRALDPSPESHPSPVERFEAFLTQHLLSGELEDPTYREAMAALAHEPRDERETRRHDVLTRFAVSDDWDISFFAYLWNEMEVDTVPEHSSVDVPVVPGADTSMTDPAPTSGFKAAEVVATGDDAPLVEQDENDASPAGQDGEDRSLAEQGRRAAPWPGRIDSTAFDDDADTPTDRAAHGGLDDMIGEGGRADEARGEHDAGEGFPSDPGPDAGPEPPSEPRPELGTRRWEAVWALGIAVVTIAGVVTLAKPWDRKVVPLSVDTAMVDTSATITTPALTEDTTTITAPAPSTPAVFIDSIRAQLATGRQKHEQAQYAAAAEVLDDAIRRLQSRTDLPERPRRALEDSLTTLRHYTHSACNSEVALGERFNRPCPP